MIYSNSNRHYHIYLIIDVIPFNVYRGDYNNDYIMMIMIMTTYYYYYDSSSSSPSSLSS